MTWLGAVLGLVVGVVLGLLGGGGSILAVPIFLYAFRLPADTAFAMSFPVVGLSALAGFFTHWRQGNVNLRIAVPYGLCAAAAAFLVARRAHLLAESLRLGMFAAFAFSAALVMLHDSFRRRPTAEPAAVTGRSAPRFSALLALEAMGVGSLTALIGVGGGFVIVPALVYLAHMPIRSAVGSSLLIIALNALSSFLGNVGEVAIDWPLAISFTAIAAIGAVGGTRLGRRVPQNRLKQAFAGLIIVLGSYLILRRLLG